MKNHFKVTTHPKSNKQNIILGNKYRITILTPELVRFEYSDNNIFEDNSTQLVWNRNFKKVAFEVKNVKNNIVIKTSKIEIRYNQKELSNKGFSIKLLSNGFTYNYGDEIDNLMGTARTLDRTNGDNVTLSKGILSRDGIALLEDNSGVILSKDGWIKERNNIVDIYFFCYGHEYRKALKDFYFLTGNTPLLPRFTLGNWWSRYYKYTQDEYIKLMDKFEEKNIPLSVAVIDMDWHLVDIDKKYGTGWTGYTWNEELFPDHVKFLSDLHSKGLKTTLNLHPHSGIRGFEKHYQTIAKHMGLDYENEEQVEFDPTNEKFVKYYYEDVLNQLEDEGVDFWWIDWQQGSKTKLNNLDPLWMLNHYGYLDSGRKGCRELILSRFTNYAGHRYPIGFSGDTHVTWETLDFQPFFTANASNIGYGWWSHDIGGHMGGYKDNELMTRWVQFGVFSPIMRLHSTCNNFNSKEPWKYGYEAERIMSDFLRLRHRLIPYLYNMNYRASYEGLPLIQPLYYEHPEEIEAYEYGNEYYFGKDLIVCPITTKKVNDLHLSKVDIYLPDGKYYDVFANRIYNGSRRLTLYRELDKIPVFAKLGSIIPLTDNIDAKSISKIPTQLHLNIYLGDNGECEMYEDDGNNKDYLNNKYVKTKMTLIGKTKKNTEFVIQKPKGDLSLLPQKRDYIIEFFSSIEASNIAHVYCNNKEIPFSIVYDSDYYKNIISINSCDTNAQINIVFDKCIFLDKNNYKRDIFDLLDKSEIRYDTKTRIYNACFENEDHWGIYNEISKLISNHDLHLAILEILKSNLDDTSYLTKKE